MQKLRIIVIAVVLGLALILAVAVNSTAAGTPSPSTSLHQRARAEEVRVHDQIAAERADAQRAKWYAAVWANEQQTLWYRWAIHTWPPLVCIRHHESSHTPPLYDDGYYAHNATSSASGAYQDLDSTWHNAALRWAPEWANGEARAAPPEVQDAVNYNLYVYEGPRHWAGSGC